MKNDEKIDIKLSDAVSDEELSSEEYFQKNYETVLRYINIADHMKQFEDQDKYYDRAIQYLKKINDDNRYKEWMNDLRRLRFGARAEGKIGLYEEGCHLRDSAKTPQDYYAAQTVFLRLAKYDANRPDYPRWITPEANAKLPMVKDAAEQAAKCEQMARDLEKKLQRKSLFASFVVIAVICAALVFSRTTECRQLLGHTFNLIGDYTSAYQKFNAVYERSGKTDQVAYNNYLEARYKAAEKELSSGELDQAYLDYAAVAKDNVHDSQAKLFKIEQEALKTTEISEIVSFASMEWRILERQDDRVLLIKDKAMSDLAFNETAGPCTWDTSSIRKYLNGEFFEENFFTDEKNALMDTEVVTPANSEYNSGIQTPNTTDKIFLLSMEEEQKYVEQLHETETCWWLRTPGANVGSMAFVYRNKEVMSYGYDVSNKEITVKPAIWVSIQ